MLLTFLMFVVALCLSAVAAFYSIVGLTAIFAAAVLPIIIMGSILEVAKLTVTVWLHEYWAQAKLTMKMYLVPAVGMLMLITSMGIFGFLSKAHMDQGMVSGDVQAKISIYDEKIKTAKENIDVNRKALKQMDEAVDQVMGRSTDEKGADKAVQIRRTQQKERQRLLAEIEAEQKKVSSLNEERAPIAAEVRKVEAEVGPIKYIAALIYGDNPDSNVLERAVRWVIIILVAVFDPLAVMMLLAAAESLKWERHRKLKETEPSYEPDDGSLTDEQLNQIKESVNPHPPGWMFNSQTVKNEPEVEKSIFEQHPYLLEPFVSFSTPPMPAPTDLDDHAAMNIASEPPGVELRTFTPEEIVALEHDEHDEHDGPSVRVAKDLWKQINPTGTLKAQRMLLARGAITELPWMKYVQDNQINFGHGPPNVADKGDQYILVDNQPTQLLKYNGETWIEINKDSTDQYVYNTAYIDYLIQKINSGEYDPELLTDAERIEITQRLNQPTN